MKYSEKIVAQYRQNWARRQGECVFVKFEVAGIIVNVRVMNEKTD